jgi:outer membrane protein TolC
MMAVSCRRAAGAVLWILFLVLPACPLSAQYSLAGLVDSASRRLPLLLEKQALVESAKAGITEARHAYLPKLNVVEELSVGSANDLAGPFLPVPGVLHSVAGSITGAPNYEAVTGNLASIYGEYELMNFGLRGAKVNNAVAFLGVQQADLEKERYLVKWQIARIYFGILRSRYQLAVDSADIGRYQAMYSVSRALTSTGVNAGVDSSLAKAGLSRTRINFNQVTGNLHRLQQQLAYLTGVENVEIALDTSWRGGLMSGAGSGAVRGMNGGMADDSAAFNPLADYYEKQRLRYSAEEELARKSYLPKIMLGAGGWARGSSIQYNNVYKPAGEGLGYQRLNYLAGVGITYDLFNGTHRKDRLAVINGQVRAADYSLRQQQLELHNQEIQADESIRIAQQNLAELPVQMQAATDAYNQKLAQYKAGIINLVDLSNASFELFQAQSTYIETLNDWYVASLDKAATTGKLDQFIQSVK